MDFPGCLMMVYSMDKFIPKPIKRAGNYPNSGLSGAGMQDVPTKAGASKSWSRVVSLVYRKLLKILCRGVEIL
jgi:hypothetical protein